MKYYKHFTNSFQDEKITLLFQNFGYEGLGLFYTALEKLAEQEKPIDTNVLKFQLKIRKRLEKCWSFIETIGLIPSINGESFNEKLLNNCGSYKISSEKTKKRVSEWREKQEDIKDVTRYKKNVTPPNRRIRRRITKEEEKEEDNDKSKIIDFDKSKSCHKSCIKIYSDWILEKTGASAKIDGGDGKAMYTIIEHLLIQEKISGDFEKVIESWKFILSKWGKLNGFLQGRKSLKQINSEFNNIIDQIKNGSTQKTGKRPATDDEILAEIARTIGGNKAG